MAEISSSTTRRTGEVEEVLARRALALLLVMRHAVGRSGRQQPRQHSSAWRPTTQLRLSERGRRAWPKPRKQSTETTRRDQQVPALVFPRVVTLVNSWPDWLHRVRATSRELNIIFIRTPCREWLHTGKRSLAVGNCSSRVTTELSKIQKLSASRSARRSRTSSACFERVRTIELGTWTDQRRRRRIGLP